LEGCAPGLEPALRTSAILDASELKKTVEEAGFIGGFMKLAVNDGEITRHSNVKLASLYLPPESSSEKLMPCLEHILVISALTFLNSFSKKSLVPSLKTVSSGNPIS